MAPRTVVIEDPGFQARFPDIVRAADGSLIATYHRAADHIGVRGELRVLDSHDDGRSWSPPRTPVHRRGDARDPKLAVLSDATLLLTWFELRWTGDGAAHERLGSFAARSTDGGRHWTEPVPIGSRLVERGGWTALHAPAVELPGGDVVQPLYGHDTQNGDDWVATLARSRDGGRTFAPADEVMLAATPGHRYAEPNLSVLADGSLAALVRVDAPGHDAHLVRSRDGGTTWTAPQLTTIPARSHHQLTLTDGRVLLTYGDATRPARPTCALLVDDPTGPWDGRATQIYDSGDPDQANPSSVEVEPGHILTLGYDVRRRQLVAIAYTLDDLAGNCSDA